MEHLSLYELEQKIKESLATAFPLPIWVVAEIGEIKVNYSGHCYLELIEKEGADGVKLKAKVNANIWANKFRLLKAYFETTTRIALSEGIKVLVKVDIRFHEVYGLSLNVVDIDPAFTVGEMKLQRSLIIQRLMEEGIVDLNKELTFPLVPQRIAVISSATAAGYQDFYNQLHNNTFGFNFVVELFPSVMQGNEAEPSIIASLEKVYTRLDCFDLVAIIRGGGSQADLACFDSYSIAANVAQFPIPVVAGIGHDKDESIVDIVAYQSFKTPTAVAAFLIETVAEFEDGLMSCASAISHHAQKLIQTHRMAAVEVEYQLLDRVKYLLNSSRYGLDSLMFDISKGVGSKLAGQHRLVDSSLNLLEKAVADFLKSEVSVVQFIQQEITAHARIRMMEQLHLMEYLVAKIDASSPQEILKKGYSLTLQKGRIVRDLSDMKGQEIETLVESGRIVSKVTEVENINPLKWQKKS